MKQRKLHAPALGVAWLLLLQPPVRAAHGQETVRMSLAGATAAEARQVTATNLSNSNLKLGPTDWSLSAGLGLEYQ